MPDLALVETEGGRDDRQARQENSSLRILSNLAAVLPPMDSGMVTVLAESMAVQGYFKHEPIVKYRLPDGTAVTIIGRHREAAAEKAEIEPEVEYFRGDPVEAVYRMMASVLQHRYLSMEQRVQVKHRLDDAGYDWDQTVRDRELHVTAAQIDEALLSQASTAAPLNHRAIARALHIEHSRLRVDRRCQALIDNGSLNHCPHRYTEDGSEARGAKPKANRPAPEREREEPSGVGAGQPDSNEPAASVGSSAAPPAPEPAPAPPVVQLRPSDDGSDPLDVEIRRRLLLGLPTDFRGLAAEYGAGASRVQNRIQFNMGWLAHAADRPGCNHGCPAHCQH